MILHPEVQQRAQDEIDRVVGSDRLPNLEDRKDLLYVEAICKECSRCNSSHVILFTTADEVTPISDGNQYPRLGYNTCSLRTMSMMAISSQQGQLSLRTNGECQLLDVHFYSDMLIMFI